MAFSLTSVRGLRVVVAVLAGVLLAVVVGFIGYAHYRAHQFLTGLPGKLGIDISQETDNVTYSQSYKGHTVFTVHAARQLQRKDGKVTLRDVGLVLYGRDGEKNEHADRIHGSEFEFDQKQGILRAVGVVYLDLAAPASAGHTAEKGASPRMIHVKTSGLVYLQKERTASTDDEVEFSSGELTGKATGASYAAADDVLVLRRNVRLSGAYNGQPMQLTASHAEFDRGGNLARLQMARYVAEGGATQASPMTLAADRAIVHTDSEGNPQRLEGEGHVALTGAGRGELAADRAAVNLNPQGQPSAAVLTGGVRYRNATAARDAAGTAQTAQLSFEAGGRPVRALLSGGVEMSEKAPLFERHLRSAAVTLALGGGGGQRVYLRGAEATGPDGAVLRTEDRDATRRSVTEVKAQRLTARFAGKLLAGVDGVGGTSVSRTAANAAGAPLSRDTSTGDTLRLDIATDAKGKLQLLRAEQHGNVATTHEGTAPKAGQAAPTDHAHADGALYEAAGDRLTMDGKVTVADEASELFANRVTFARGPGVTQADGAVRVSYRQPGNDAAEVVHVLADRAASTRATGVTQFTAATGGRVRLWQAGSQVEAPQVELDRLHGRVVARSSLLPAAGETPLVRATLSGAPDKAGVVSPVRITATEMTYTDAAHQVDLRGPVRVDDKNGRMSAREATVFLAPPAKGTATTPAPAAGLFAGKVERMVGLGSVQLDQPGRRATGERLTYNAADGLFTLTGTSAAPPRLLDEARGTITGASLRFHTGDESVTVTGAADGEHTGGRVHTEVHSGK